MKDSELMNKSGIYVIWNTISGKFYVGSAINFRNRKRSHFYRLKNGDHKNKHLQCAWNKYGYDAFKFEIVEYVTDLNLLLKREQDWIDTFDFNKELYNQNPTAGSNFGKMFSEKARNNMSNAAKGRIISKEMIEKMLETKQKRYGGEPSRKKIVQIDNTTGKFIKIFDSIASAANELGLHRGNISKICNKTKDYVNSVGYHRKTCGGYRWRFL